MIAPCGMNCMLCSAHLRDDKRCPGCNIRTLRYRIKNCPAYKKNKFKFCYMCQKFPCSRIRHLDDRYTTRYGMSMIENLEFIRDKGMGRFLKSQKKRWTTPEGIICVHNKKIYPRK